MTTPFVRVSYGRYDLLERLAVGGMGELFVARDRGLFRKVVIKRVRGSLSDDPNYVRMFLDEARALAAIDHPNAVRVFDIGRAEGHLFFAMERLEGWDLGTILRQLNSIRGLLPIGLVLRIIGDSALGLHAAHTAVSEDGTALHIIHRDVSPGNIFVTRDGVPKLIDFGVAKSRIQRHQTNGNFVTGKARYMSPEQLLAEPVDARTDLFSLGVVFHELLTGVRLFHGKTLPEILAAVTRGPIPPPLRPGAPVDERIARVVMKSLNRDRRLRFASAQELHQAISEIRHEDEEASSVGALAAYVVALCGEPVQPDHTVDEIEFTGEAGTNPEPRDTVQDPTISERLDNIGRDGRPTEESTAVGGFVTPTAVEPEEQIQPFEGQTEISNDGPGEMFEPRDTERSTWRQRATRLLSHRISQVNLRPSAGRGGLVVVLVVFAAISGVAAWWLLPGRESPAEGEGPPPKPVVAESSPPTAEVQIPEMAQPPRKKKSLPLSRSAPKATRSKKAVAGRRTGSAKFEVLPPVKPPAVFEGRLTVETTPWTRVFYRGDLLGVTPLINVALPVGSVTLRFVNPEFGIDKTQVVRIPVDGAVRHHFALSP